MVRGKDTYERDIMVRYGTPRHIPIGSKGCFFHRLGRRYPRTPWLSGSIPSCSGFSSRMGAIPHQRDGNICAVRSVTPTSGLPPELPTSEHRYDGCRQQNHVHAVRKGKSRNKLMHGLVRKIFWLQVDADFTLKIRWVPSRETSEADKLIRPEAWEHVQLRQSHFNDSLTLWGSFGVDLMASTASTQQASTANGMLGPSLPFYSRFTPVA